ncbi:hypothetical protein K504DRAFT_418304 [Pleomassaria siparia CBS 279.74]|uniref:Nephrocystin 3-like N-terminal domain-containing protein n=1 Tax=Pleomassaria siparia CBS 279.74 TaxID=1314801 RepID=A0A6G1JSV3_9PLEO|nr:hypothetical protein K504DRAFT_418304 [Pleomassaria siparia CBS 279.74]
MDNSTTLGDEDGDVFAQDSIVHPAIQDNFAIPPDIFTKLFDGFFNHPLFNRWLKYQEHWPLDIVGGPGAGKTTFAALAAERIRDYSQSPHHHHSYLATVFISAGPVGNDLILVEDVLCSIYRQLTPSAAQVGPAVLDRYSDYQSAQHKGRNASVRIGLISEVLQWRVADICVKGQAFLILDNVDQCMAPLKELLERELCILQRIGLKVMVALRLLRHEAFGAPLDRVCDICRIQTSLYWYCTRCREDICENCKGEATLCRNCDFQSTWAQPDSFTIFIDSIPKPSLRSYVAWDLEREHGDLGLGTLENRLEPPLSLFGMAFRKAKPNGMGNEWIEDILNYTGTSIMQVKLALDRIHNSPSPDLVDLHPERLPANVQAIFNAGVNAITQQANNQANLALKSIAVVGKTGEVFEGKPIVELAASLKERRHPSSSNHLPLRSTEDVLHASRGYLKLLQVHNQTHVIVFNRLFYLFIFDEYNEELIMAYSQLRTSKIPRSATHVPKKIQEDSQNTSWAEVVEGLKSYQSPSLASITGLGSPSPLGREPLSAMRSQTFFQQNDVSNELSSKFGLGVFLKED